jgi:Ecdysteroid kinase-like family
MARLAIPSVPETMTPAWLTEALRAGGVITDAMVTSATRQCMEAFGWTTQMVRLRLSYDQPQADAPHSLVVKISAQESSTRHFFRRFYQREVDFYREVAPHVPLRVPRCYYADYDILTHNHVLLLEDMAPSVVGEAISGADVDVAMAYTRAIAALHAQCWQSVYLEALAERFPAHGAAFARGYSQCLEAGLDVMRPYCGAMTKVLARRLQDGLQARWMQQGTAPNTLIQWDAHAGNLLYPSIGGGEFAIVDWQNCAVSRGIWDVTRFCVLSLPIEERRAAQHDILALYVATLAERGVNDYSFRHCLADYRALMPLQFAQQLRFFASMQSWDDGRRAWVAAITPRVVAALHDAAAAEVCG